MIRGVIMSELVTSSSNPIIKVAKSLHKKKERWERNLFFVEGVRAVEEAVISNAKIECILYSDSLLATETGENLLDVISQSKFKLVYVTDKLMKEISDTEKPQGVFAIIGFNLSDFKGILNRERNFLILLDRVQDPGNLGTIIRTADAMGANGVIVTSGCVDVFNPKVIRSTMGSIFHIPVVYYENVVEAMIKLKEFNILTMATSLEANKYSYDVDFTKDFALIIGNEASGIDKEILDISDISLKIPMIGMAESLNAAIASAIIMYEAARQRQNF